MKPAWLAKVPPVWRARLVRLGFNLHPAFRGTGGRVIHVADDLSHIRIRLPLTWRTKNIVGSLYGGSLFAVTDGVHPMLLMAALGDAVIVWDKAASIRYKRPGFSTLYADFSLSAAEVSEIRQSLDVHDELDRTFLVELKDEHGVVHTIVERTVYIAHKKFYREKISKETANDFAFCKSRRRARCLACHAWSASCRSGRGEN